MGLENLREAHPRQSKGEGEDLEAVSRFTQVSGQGGQSRVIPGQRGGQGYSGLQTVRGGFQVSSKRDGKPKEN